jgi:hypothetical protein
MADSKRKWGTMHRCRWNNEALEGSMLHASEMQRRADRRDGHCWSLPDRYREQIGPRCHFGVMLQISYIHILILIFI